jgi:hypothetical protein
LDSNESLRILDLASILFGEPGVIAMLEKVSHPSLLELYIEKNCVEDHNHIPLIEEMSKRNYSLRCETIKMLFFHYLNHNHKEKLNLFDRNILNFAFFPFLGLAAKTNADV